MRRPQLSWSLVALLPLLIFLCFFFVWPLVMVMSQSVTDAAVSSVLVETSRVAPDWDRQSPPSPDLQAAFVTDLRNAPDEQAIGDMVRRLNSAQQGFRTLMAKTLAAIRTNPSGPVELAAIDERWSRVEFWRTIVEALSPRTDRYLLAAVDLKRADSGAIVRQPAEEAANVVLLVRTFEIAITVTIFCLLLGYPYALLLTATTGWKRAVMLAAILLPLWTSLLVRTAAWFMLLQERGLINDVLLGAGLVSSPLPLIFHRTGVIIAMVYVALPLMVLPVYSVLLTIPGNLMNAAASLGANPLLAFVRVLLPLSARGIAAGSLLVFITALGYYITPALIGGPNDQMISSVIAFHALQSANWGLSSALGLLLLTITVVLYLFYDRLMSKQTRVLS